MTQSTVISPSRAPSTEQVWQKQLSEHSEETTERIFSSNPERRTNISLPRRQDGLWILPRPLTSYTMWTEVLHSLLINTDVNNVWRFTSRLHVPSWRQDCVFTYLPRQQVMNVCLCVCVCVRLYERQLVTNYQKLICTLFCQVYYVLRNNKFRIMRVLSITSATIQAFVS